MDALAAMVVSVIILAVISGTVFLLVEIGRRIAEGKDDSDDDE